jgi:hypothetical protein
MDIMDGYYGWIPGIRLSELPYSIDILQHFGSAYLYLCRLLTEMNGLPGDGPTDMPSPNPDTMYQQSSNRKVGRKELKVILQGVIDRLVVLQPPE